MDSELGDAELGAHSLRFYHVTFAGAAPFCRVLFCVDVSFCSGPSLGDMDGAAFIYGELGAGSVPGRIKRDVLVRQPGATVLVAPTRAQIPALLEGDARVFVLIAPVKAYSPVEASRSRQDVKSRLTGVRRAEDLLQAVEAVFHQGSIRLFVQLGRSDEERIESLAQPSGSRRLVVYETEVAFVDADPKRIPVVKTTERLLSPIEHATELMLAATAELDHLTIAQPLDVAALHDMLHRFLFEESWQSPHQLARSFLVAAGTVAPPELVKERNDLSLMLVQLLVFAKKALIIHERSMADTAVEWQEKAWDRYARMCTAVAVYVEGLEDLDRLSFVSIRPKLLVGELLKRGDKGFVKAWRSRWFQQRGKLVYYYRSQRDAETGAAPQGSIDLAAIGRVEERTDPAQGAMVAVHVPGRVFLMAPPPNAMPDTLRFWLTGFRAWRAYLSHMPYDEEEAAGAGLMSGNLWKKGVRGVRGKGLGWKQRYFTQIGDALFYYAQNGVTALGHIDLTDVSWVHFPKPNVRRKFKLYTLRDDRIWTLRCDTDAELETWRTGVLSYCSNGPPVSQAKLHRTFHDFSSSGSDAPVATQAAEAATSSSSSPRAVALGSSSGGGGGGASTVVPPAAISPSSPTLIRMQQASQNAEAALEAKRTAPRPVSMVGLVGAAHEDSALLSRPAGEVTCVKCTARCSSARWVCSSCGVRLRSATATAALDDMLTNRRMTALPPLPPRAPPKSDRVAYRAWKDLVRRYKEAGLDMRTLRRNAGSSSSRGSSGLESPAGLSSGESDQARAAALRIASMRRKTSGGLMEQDPDGLADHVPSPEQRASTVRAPKAPESAVGLADAPPATALDNSEVLHRVDGTHDDALDTAADAVSKKLEAILALSISDDDEDVDEEDDEEAELARARGVKRSLQQEGQQHAVVTVGEGDSLATQAGQSSEEERDAESSIIMIRGDYSNSLLEGSVMEGLHNF